MALFLSGGRRRHGRCHRGHLCAAGASRGAFPTRRHRRCPARFFAWHRRNAAALRAARPARPKKSKKILFFQTQAYTDI